MISLKLRTGSFLYKQYSISGFFTMFNRFKQMMRTLHCRVIVCTLAIICLIALLRTGVRYEKRLMIMPHGYFKEKIHKIRHNTGGQTTFQFNDQVSTIPDERSKIDLRKSVQTKVILFWTKLYFSKAKETGYSQYKHCDYSNCYFTSNRDYLNQSDAVIFHMWNLARHKEKEAMPKRWPHQRWVLQGNESPISANFHLYYDEEFNLTITYRNKSDIHFPHGYFTKIDDSTKKKPMFNGTVNFAKDKTKLVAWVISHCRTHNKRLKYIEELGKYIQVDGYGKCAKRPCSDDNSRDSTFACNAMLVKHYKFFLAFENSFCDEYITEKIWNKLEINIVPVVLGQHDYHKTLPPNSYIDARNFSSPEALAKYLLQLDHDDKMYNSYFAWKAHYQVRYPDVDCLLCEYLHTQKETKSYTDIGKWWGGCTHPDVFCRGIADAIIK